MTLEELQQHYDWSQYCVVVGQETFCDVKDFVAGLDVKHLKDDVYFTIKVHAKYSLDEILPDVDQFINDLQYYFDDFSDSLLSDETAGIDELKQAYQEYLNKNKSLWQVGPQVRLAMFSGQELKRLGG